MSYPEADIELGQPNDSFSSPRGDTSSSETIHVNTVQTWLPFRIRGFSYNTPRKEGHGGRRMQSKIYPDYQCDGFAADITQSKITRLGTLDSQRLLRLMHPSMSAAGFPTCGRVCYCSNKTDCPCWKSGWRRSTGKRSTCCRWEAAGTIRTVKEPLS